MNNLRNGLFNPHIIQNIKSVYIPCSQKKIYTFIVFSFLLSWFQQQKGLSLGFTLQNSSKSIYNANISKLL